MIEKITMPDVGEGVASGVVVAVLLHPGDRVKVDDTVVELETDKAVVEIPSTVAGTVVRVLVKEGDEVKVGEPIAEVQTDAVADEGPSDSSQAPSETVSEGDPPEERTAKPDSPAQGGGDGKEEQAPASTQKRSPDPPVPASPSIRRMARELGVDLRLVAGRGPGGRIREADVKAYVKNRMQAAPDGPEGSSPDSEPELPDFSRWGDVEVQALETVRRITVESTARSWRTVPHVTQFDEADITGLETFMANHADSVSNAGGKLTVTAILTKVCAAALQKFPRFNASLDLQDQRIVYKKYVHIGIAVDTPRGLLMPVIRNADTKSITALAVEIVDLAKRCRDKKIKPTELEGGTFSISNQGGIGGVGFTPIVLWPQAAILGVSRASTSPRPLGECIQWSKKLPLSLSYDHRMIDGADAARFLGWICESLASPFNLILD